MCSRNWKALPSVEGAHLSLLCFCLLLMLINTCQCSKVPQNSPLRCNCTLPQCQPRGEWTAQQTGTGLTGACRYGYHPKPTSKARRLAFFCDNGGPRASEADGITLVMQDGCRRYYPATKTWRRADYFCCDDKDFCNKNMHSYAWSPANHGQRWRLNYPWEVETETTAHKSLPKTSTSPPSPTKQPIRITGGHPTSKTTMPSNRATVTLLLIVVGSAAVTTFFIISSIISYYYYFVLHPIAKASVKDEQGLEAGCDER